MGRSAGGGGHQRQRELIRTERGATAVELALIATLFFALLFGIIEVGMAMRTRASVTNAAAAGARAVSVGTTTPFADYNGVQAISEALDITGVEIERIIVYRASSPTAPPTTGCQSGTPASGICNVYTQAHLQRPETDFGCGPASPDRYWCPSSRSAEVGSLDLVGVQIVATHEYLTGFVGDQFDFEAQSVLPVEPAGT